MATPPLARTLALLTMPILLFSSACSRHVPTESSDAVGAVDINGDGRVDAVIAEDKSDVDLHARIGVKLEPLMMAGGTCELMVSEAEALAYIDALIAQVDALEAAGSLNAGRANALRRHLENVRRQIAAGRICPALAEFRAFHRQVDVFEDAGVLTSSEADRITDAVEEVLTGPPILNPSFEIDGDVYLVPVSTITAWSFEGDFLEPGDYQVHQFGGGAGSVASIDGFLVTDGTYGAYIFSKTGADPYGYPVPRTFTAGEYAGLSQAVDLTGISAILFDGEVRQFWDGTIFEARVLVDGTVRWSNNTVGTYLNQSMDVSGLTGMHTLELRIEAVATGTVSGLLTSRWFLFDNIRVVSSP